MGDGSDGCGGEVELCTVGITVETEAMSEVSVQGGSMYRMKRRG